MPILRGSFSLTVCAFTFAVAVEPPGTLPVSGLIDGVPVAFRQRAHDIAQLHPGCSQGRMPADALLGLQWMFREGLRQHAAATALPVLTRDDLELVIEVLRVSVEHTLQADVRFPDKAKALERNELMSHGVANALEIRIRRLRDDPLFPGCKLPLSASQSLRLVRALAGIYHPNPASITGADPLARSLASIDAYWSTIEMNAIYDISRLGHAARINQDYDPGAWSIEWRGHAGSWPVHVYLANTATAASAGIER